MESPYKIKHWSPVKRVPKSVDCWGNTIEYEEVSADEYADRQKMAMNDIFDFVGQEFNPTTYKNTDYTYFRTVPSTQEIRDKNASLMESALLNNKFTIRTELRECSDGAEYEILEIRGPKASGFFVHFFEAQTFDYVKR